MNNISTEFSSQKTGIVFLSGSAGELDWILPIIDDLLKKDFNLSQVCSDIVGVMPHQQRSVLVQYLFGIAKADGHVSESEVKVIQQIADYLRISSMEFEQLKAMFYKSTFIE